jgi:Domain of unknown function (DUF4394)
MRRNSFLGRGTHANAMALLTLAALAATGCGKGGVGGPTDPGSSDGPSDPGPTDPASGWTGPAPVGTVLYAVDLGNTFYVFGSESFGVPTAEMKITGLPILKRIIGITIRPSNGKLYGVGNDSRVYTIDPLTAAATPVGSGPFSPKIADMFDIHFAMALEPNGDRVRLIAAESGANWSISLDDGTATLGETSHYGAGIELEGQTPRLLGMFFAPPADPADPSLCQNLAYGIDADKAIMIATCDPATGEWWPTVTGEPQQGSVISRPAANLSQASLAGTTVPLEDLANKIARCGELLLDPSNLAPRNSEPRPEPDKPWDPRTPESSVVVFLGGVGKWAVRRVQVVGSVLGVTDGPDVATEEPPQTATWVHPQYVPHPVPPPDPVPQLRHQVRQEVQLSVAQSPEPHPSTPPAPPGDPRARCS